MQELSVGDPAPDFSARVANGATIQLSEVLSEGKGVILYFYPRDETPGCTVQACDFRDSFARLADSGWRVVGVSTDSASSHQKFIDNHELPFELVVDEDSSLHEAYGTWREKNMYGRTYMGTLRSTFAISSEGTLEWAGYGVRAKGHVEMLMESLGVQ
ncbi:MAG: peroxiredoxin [Candidatus Thalassarchaeaceae archaeon]|nr:peroxiredoxin [Candidatus Thalassarchaeaceae archaeon]MDP6703489.1 peroxiredoxin [Candidatus Thalassarchaeaceae archaeon]MDP7004344.1 peroxiredoxin [Candidatus Thalassarchaeaceae archaeon]